MTITPEQAKRLTAEERAVIRSAEEGIDESIRDYFGRGESRAIYSLGGVCSMSGRVRNAIKRKYEQAGWKVQYRSDQREGDWLEFRPAGAEEQRRYESTKSSRGTGIFRQLDDLR